MPRNGSGGYVQPVSDFVPGALIKSADVNSWLGDLGGEITNSIAKDGQTSPTADLPMGGFKHTDVANASAANQYAALGQVGWEFLSSAPVSGVGDVLVNWTPSIYERIAVHIVGWRYSSGSNNDLYCRISRGGSVVTGTNSYITSNVHWIGGVGAANAAPFSFAPLTDFGSNGEPASILIEVDQHESSVTPIIRAYTRWTANTPDHSHGLFTAVVAGGSGPMDGIVVGVISAAPTIAAGRITILGLRS